MSRRHFLGLPNTYLCYCYIFLSAAIVNYKITSKTHFRPKQIVKYNMLIIRSNWEIKRGKTYLNSRIELYLQLILIINCLQQYYFRGHVCRGSFIYKDSGSVLY